MTINQITYLMFVFFIIILNVKAHLELRLLDISADKKSFWLKSINYVLISTVSFAIASFGMPLFLITANLCLIGGLIYLGLLFRSLRQPVSQRFSRYCILLFILFALVMSIMLIWQAPYIYRYRVVASVLFIITAWHLKEIIQVIKIDKSIHLKFFVMLLVHVLILIVVRVANFDPINYKNVNYVYQESSVGLLARIIMMSLYFGMYVFVSSYFYDKLLLREKDVVTQLKATMLALKETTAEKEEIDRLLKEREHLLFSLVRAEKRVQSGVLSASIAHELSQPLCAVKINIQSLHRIVRHEKSHLFDEVLDRVDSNIDRVTGIIDTLKQLFIAPNGQYEQISVDQFIKSLDVILRSNAQKKGIQLVYELNAPKAVNVIVGEFQQVIINLLNNAVTALSPLEMENKKIVIKTQQLKESLRVLVIDNGMGVPEDLGDSIFDLMKTTNESGMGIGLWLSRYIVERHGGSLVYKNQPNSTGVAFIVELPSVINQ